MNDEKSVHHRFAVLTSNEADRNVLTEILSSAGIGFRLCATTEELCRAIREEVDGAIITDEMIIGEGTTILQRTLDDQAEWSDCPLIILGSSRQNLVSLGKLLETIEQYRQIRLLERPVHTVELMSAIRSAIRSRMHQYRVRDELYRRRQAEKRLQAEAVRKNDFIAILGHELRNPLAALALAIDDLYRHPSSERQSRNEHVIRTQLDHMQRMVNDLLDASGSVRKKLELNRRCVDVGEQMQYALTSIRTLVEEKNQRIRFSTPSEPLCLEADPLRLQQVFTNLLKNASMYTPRDGEIRFELVVEDETAVITCSDNGVGIRADRFDAIFEPFLQIESSLQKQESGLGLGLALVKGLVELHGGSVEVASEGEGKGSTFTVRLPIIHETLTGAGDRAEPTDKPIEMAAALPVVSTSVLIVEDNRDFAELLASTLTEEGCMTIVTVDGEDAIRQARENMPDYVIIDIGLPGKDGYSVAEELKKMAGMEKAVLIALSGYTPDTRKIERYFDHYVVKGSNVDDLFSIIRRH